MLFRSSDSARFENERSRTRDKCSWCAIPNKQDGLGYGLIMLEEDGPAIYAAFVSVILVCSKHMRPRHGLLTHDGLACCQPYSSAELAVKTKMPKALIERMLEFCTRPEIDWIQCLPDEPPVNPPSTPRQPTRKEVEREEVEGKEYIPRIGNSINNAIIHRPEEARDIKIKEKDDFFKHDVTSLFCSMAGENSGPGMGWISKQLKALASRTDDARACAIFREELLRMWTEIQQGESVERPGAAMVGRFKKLMGRHGGIAK